MHAQLSSHEKDAISLFKGKLEKRCGDNLMKLLLFGSRARGEGSSTSDIDLLVLLREESFRAQKEILDDAAEIVLEQGINLSPCVMGIESLERLRGLERLFARDIDREGIAL